MSHSQPKYRAVSFNGFNDRALKRLSFCSDSFLTQKKAILPFACPLQQTDGPRREIYPQQRLLWRAHVVHLTRVTGVM